MLSPSLNKGPSHALLLLVAAVLPCDASPCLCVSFTYSVFGRWNFHKLLVGADGALAGVSLVLMHVYVQRTNVVLFLASTALLSKQVKLQLAVSMGVKPRSYRKGAGTLFRGAFVVWTALFCGGMIEENRAEPLNIAMGRPSFRPQVFGSELSPLEPDVTEAIEDALPTKPEQST